MAIQHADITDPDIHEPKGVATASLGQIYIADGAGSGTWINPLPRGFVYFSNIAVPLIITYPSVYTKVNASTTASGFPREVTESTTSKLTYTGTTTKPVEITSHLFIDQSSGANKDIDIAIYKNGTIIAASEAVITTITATKVHVTLSAQLLAATDDYFEVYIKNTGGSGDVKLYSFTLSLSGIGIQ